MPGVRSVDRLASEAHAAEGVLVLNTMAAIGAARASTLLLYDLPENAASWQLQFIPFALVASGDHLDVVSFADTTGCLPHEAIERRAMDSGSRVTADEILESL